MRTSRVASPPPPSPKDHDTWAIATDLARPHTLRILTHQNQTTGLLAPPHAAFLPDPNLPRRLPFPSSSSTPTAAAPPDSGEPSRARARTETYRTGDMNPYDLRYADPSSYRDRRRYANPNPNPSLAHGSMWICVEMGLNRLVWLFRAATLPGLPCSPRRPPRPPTPTPPRTRPRRLLPWPPLVATSRASAGEAVVEARAAVGGVEVVVVVVALADTEAAVGEEVEGTRWTRSPCRSLTSGALYPSRRTSMWSAPPCRPCQTWMCRSIVASVISLLKDTTCPSRFATSRRPTSQVCYFKSGFC